MELRRLSLCLVVMLAVYAHCSDAHSMRKRTTDEDDYGTYLGDEASDTEAQNDADGGNDGEEENSIPAKIMTLPAVYNVTAGRTVRLECKVDPSEGAVIQWSKNANPLFMGKMPLASNDRASIVEDSNDLLIRDVKPSDNGVYKCTVLQVAQTSIEHVLSVQESPRIVRFTATDNGTVVEGSDLKLTCSVAGTPPPQIIWSRDNEEGNVRLQEKDGEFTLNSVLLRGVTRARAGRYYCYAINGAGHAQAEILVSVLHKPSVHVHKTVINSVTGVEAVLQCAAHGQPRPVITWYKDGTVIDDASVPQYSVSTEGSRSNLTVMPQGDEDFGTFTCVAMNNHGKHNRSIELVQRPVLEDLSVEGNKLAWTVHSHLPLTGLELQLVDMEEGKMTLIKVPVPRTEGHEYEIVHVLEDLSPGKYEVNVRAQNTKEWSGLSEPVVVDYETQPMSIQHASVYRGDSHSIRPATSVLLSTIFMYLLVRMF